MKFKLMKALMATTLLVSSLTGIGAVSAATETNTDQAQIRIHKRIFPAGETSTLTQNTGEIMNFGGKALNGAGFSIYDVTDEYYHKLGDKHSETEINTVISEIQDESISAAPDYATKIGNEITTAGEGVADFAKLPIHKGGQYAAYLVLETTTPVTPTITKKAVPMVVVMPVYKPGTTTINSQIHLYPKNETDEDQKVLTNQANFTEVDFNGTKYPNVSSGALLNYALTVNIPVNIAEANVQSFVIQDAPSNGLALADLAAVKVGDLVQGTDYTIAATNNGFEIALKTDAPNVKQLAGQKLLVTYPMQLTASVDPDQVIQNKATISVNNQPGTDLIVKTVTGGKKFKKIDAQTDKGLAGAQFVVKKGDQFAMFKQDQTDTYLFDTWVSDEAQATKISSGNNGQLSVVGLANGNHSLIEVKAPNGYLLNENNRPTKDFTVVAGQFGTETIKFENIRKGGFLPQTGSIGIYAFVVVGLMLMGGAYFWNRKVKR